MKKKLLFLAALALLAIGALAGCGNRSADGLVVIYSNADLEAIEVMTNTLNDNGFQGQFEIQVFGTSDLSARLVAEGVNIESDIVTLSTFFLDTEQEMNNLFADFDTPDGLIAGERQTWESPLLGLEGGLVVNTQVLEQQNLPMPTSIKDLADPVYAGWISVSNPASSTTAWLMVQALVQTYGEDEAKEILTGIIKNAGPHLETSGSAPIRKVESGEVAVGFGLRHQGAALLEHGIPAKVVDPSEGNFVLTESVALMNRDEINPKAKEMAAVLASKTRSELIKIYPTPLFKDEVGSSAEEERIKKFEEPLTTALLQQHIALFNAAMEQAAN